MGFLDTLLGRTKPVRPNLDALFAVPTAAQNSLAGLGFEATGVGAVCFKAAEGAAAGRSRADVRELLTLDRTQEVELVDDEFGFTWAVCRQAVPDLSALVVSLHVVNTTVVEAGFGAMLLCTAIGFRAGERRLGLVYLYKRGTVYPFVPRTESSRDNALELQIGAAIAADLPTESDVSRWFPIWHAPVP
jgi:hypothetical protein